ncbi:hypothetical protein CP989_25715, partial [Enterobacter hormaechei]
RRCVRWPPRAFNRIFADCNSPIAGELESIDGKVFARLYNQQGTLCAAKFPTGRRCVRWPPRAFNRIFADCNSPIAGELESIDGKV